MDPTYSFLPGNGNMTCGGDKEESEKGNNINRIILYTVIPVGVLILLISGIIFWR